MLDRAKKALDALKEGQRGASGPGPLIVTTMILVVLTAGAGLVIHTFFEKGGSKVDAISVALLAVVLIAPFVPRLRAIELGGAKAQWQEETVTSLKDVIAVIDYQNQVLERLYQDSIAQEQAAEDVGPAPDLATVPTMTALLPPRSVRHVLWVDDNPVNNSYEIEALRTIAEVTVVTETAKALRVLQVEEIDAVISDIGRVELGMHVEHTTVTTCECRAGRPSTHARVPGPPRADERAPIGSPRCGRAPAVGFSCCDQWGGRTARAWWNTSQGSQRSFASWRRG